MSIITKENEELSVANMPDVIYAFAYWYPKEFPEGYSGGGAWTNVKTQYKSVKYVKVKE